MAIQFSHEKLKVYQKAISFAAWVQPVIESLPAKLSVRDQLDRASTSIALNIAKGNVKASQHDRARFWQIAMGSAVECAACLDVLKARGFPADDGVEVGKSQLLEVTRMLARLLSNLGTVIAEEVEYGGERDEDEDEEQLTVNQCGNSFRNGWLQAKEEETDHERIIGTY